MDFDHPLDSDFHPDAAVSQSTRWATTHPLAMLDSRAVLRGQREVLINHAGQVYRLRHTRNGKLILTK